MIRSIDSGFNALENNKEDLISWFNNFSKQEQFEILKKYGNDKDVILATIDATIRILKTKNPNKIPSKNEIMEELKETFGLIEETKKAA